MSERIFNHTAHKALWDWLSKNPKKNKHDWPGWRYNGGDLEVGINGCFACESTVCDGRIDCARCPLIWPKGSDSDCEDDIYHDWRFAKEVGNYKVSALLAEEIRDLPVRDGVKCV